MWLKKALEKKHINNLKEYYSRSDRRFSLRDGVESHPSFTQTDTFHLAGYVSKAYNINGHTYMELTTTGDGVITITAPKFTKPESVEFLSILCKNVKEYRNNILDHSVHERSCSEVIVL